MTESKIYWGVEVPQRVDLRKFGLVMAAVLALVSGYLWYKDAMDPAQVVFSVAAGFLIVGLVLPVVLTPIYFPWMWLARILAFVNTHLLLGFVFYTLFTFIGLGMRLLGRDPLDRKILPDSDSYWQRRESPLLSREHYLRQF
ncbi:MAG: SxtJ family membrane protein [Candidatus Latescibacteria bacterium]|nr:SxtJ family membrane protein [Candidatus Latescibacterota bacterium]